MDIFTQLVQEYAPSDQKLSIADAEHALWTAGYRLLPVSTFGRLTVIHQNLFGDAEDLIPADLNATAIGEQEGMTAVLCINNGFLRIFDLANAAERTIFYLEEWELIHPSVYDSYLNKHEYILCHTLEPQVDLRYVTAKSDNRVKVILDSKQPAGCLVVTDNQIRITWQAVQPAADEIRVKSAPIEPTVLDASGQPFDKAIVKVLARKVGMEPIRACLPEPCYRLNDTFVSRSEYMAHICNQMQVWKQAGFNTDDLGFLIVASHCN